MKTLFESEKVNFDPYYALQYLDKLIELQKELNMDMSDYIYSACDLIHSGFHMSTPEDVKVFNIDGNEMFKYVEDAIKKGR